MTWPRTKKKFWLTVFRMGNQGFINRFGCPTFEIGTTFFFQISSTVTSYKIRKQASNQAIKQLSKKATKQARKEGMEEEGRHAERTVDERLIT